MGVEVGVHAEGMNACISTTSAVQGDRFPGNGAEGCLQGFLDGEVVLLSLPTAVIAAVIGDNQTNIPGRVHGKNGAPIKPVPSGNPFIKFMFCIA